MKILVTGGTGSIGESVVRALMNDPKVSEVVVLSRDEFKQHNLRQDFPSKKLKLILGDIRDRQSLVRAFKDVDVIFHAAAFKHVPMGESFPEEFVKTNVLGTINVFDVAEDCGVKKVILLSTDKAAHAASVLGMTKGLAERIMIARANSGTKTIFSAIRLGNVLASRGSVIPLFVEMIRNKKNITLTDPSMTRFVLSIPETEEFIRFAMNHGKQGDIFVKKCEVMEMGNMVKALLKILNSKVSVEVIGRREGERVHELLANKVELSHAEDMGSYFRIINSFYPVGVKNKSKTKTALPADYSSDTIAPLSVEETEKVLLSLDYIKKEINF